MPRRTWTDEQRQQARERLEAGRAKREAEKMAKIAKAPAAPMSQEDAAEELKVLAAALFSAAGRKEERSKALDELESFLGKLNPKDFPELAESEIVNRFLDQMAERKIETNPNDPPGTIYMAGTNAQHKKPWQWSDLQRSGIDIVEFEVNEPETVIWNGLRRDYQPGIVYQDWKCFVEGIREKNRAMRLAHEHVEYMFKRRNSLSDPTIANLNTAVVRGTADEGSYIPAGGLFRPEWETGEGGDEDGEAA